METYIYIYQYKFTYILFMKTQRKLSQRCFFANAEPVLPEAKLYSSVSTSLLLKMRIKIS